jgi:hypothetical protein
MSLLRHRTLLPIDAAPACLRGASTPAAARLRQWLLPVLWIWSCAGAFSFALFEPLRLPSPQLGEPVFWLLIWPLSSLILLVWRSRRRA